MKLAPYIACVCEGSAENAVGCNSSKGGDAYGLKYSDGFRLTSYI